MVNRNNNFNQNNWEALKNTTTIIDLNTIILKQRQVIYNLLTVIKELPGSIYWKNKEGTYLGHNNFSKEEMEKLNLSSNINGKTDFDLFPYEVAKQYRQHDLKVMNSGQPCFKEEALSLPNGKQVVQISHKKPLRDENGNIIGIMGNTIDITDLKQIEKELIDEKENNANMANSLVWLLHNVQFYFQRSLKEVLLLTNIMLPGQDNSNQKSLLTEVKDFIIILLNDCEDLLNFNLNTLNTSKIPLSRKNFKFTNLINEVINKSMKFAKRRNLKLSSKISEQIPTVVIGDLFRIKKILQLILANTIRTSIIDSTIKLDIELIEKFDNKITIAIIFEHFKELFQDLSKKEININKHFNVDVKKLFKIHCSSDPKIAIIELLIKELNGNLKLVQEKNEKVKNIVTLELNFNN